MDDLIAAVKARGLVNKVAALTTPVDLQAYLGQVSATVKFDKNLTPSEPGYSAPVGDRYRIVVNDNDTDERKRFTICHELGHIVLKLPSEHVVDGDRYSYKKRSDNEVFCDVFAAELLLPYKTFKPLVDGECVSFDAITKLAEDFEASLTCTGSRYAANAEFPCVFVLSEAGNVRYASRSKAIREMNAWVPIRQPVPGGSLSSNISKVEHDKGPKRVAADIWFSDWKRGGLLLEEARYLSKWDQTLTLLWFDDDEIDNTAAQTHADREDDELLPELTGDLPWPGKRHRS